MIEENNSINEKFENYVTSKSRKLKERTFADYLDASILIMIAGILIAIGLTFFINIVFDPHFNWKEVGVNTVLITACTIAVYLLVRYYAMRKGRKTKAWMSASEKLTVRGKNVIESDRAKFIPKYCREWEDERLESDVTITLAPVGITYGDFKEKYAAVGKRELKKCEKLTSYQLKVVLKAKRIKRLKFDERYFYVNASTAGRRRSPSGGLDTRKMNRLTIARIALTSVATSLVSATLLRDIIIDFSASSVIKCVIKLAIIIFFGAIAMIGGYNFTAVKETDEMNAKSDEIDVFLKWCDSRESIAKSPLPESAEQGEEP